MFIRSTLVLASLALPLAAQDTGDVKASTVGAATFYEAYFLDNDQSRSAEATKKALGLYQKFLAAHPDHKLAGKAASRAVILWYATGDIKGARGFAKKHDVLITKTEEAVNAARRERPAANEELTTKLSEAMRTARDDGNNAEASRIMNAMRRSGGGRGMFGRGQGGRGGFGGARGQGGRGQGGRGARGQGGRGARGGRGGGATIPKIAGMKQEEAKKAVETLVTSMERMIDFMAQRGQADQADKLEAKLDKIQDLVDDGKLDDAQKILDTLQADMGSARGGDQGGRRRRGGDAGGAGGAGGGERRRRGGAGGDAGAGAGAGGERRRRRG